MPTKEQVIEVLKQCFDPELQFDVWTLGLIYDLQAGEKNVYIKMTFTSPACPYGEILLRDIQAKLRHFHGQDLQIKIDVVFEPPWQPSEEILAMLGFG